MARIDVLLQGYPMRISMGAMGFCTIPLIESSKGTKVLLDNGFHNNRVNLLEKLKEHFLTPDDIDIVVLSHLHFDHVNNTRLFKKSKVLLSKYEIPYAEEQTKSDSPEDPYIADFYEQMLEMVDYETIEGDIDLTDDIKILELPGHTPGQLGLAVKTNSGIVVCSNDAAKDAKEFLQGYPLIFCNSRMEELQEKGKESIRKILDIADIIIPAHDRTFSLKNNQIMWDQNLELNIILY